MLKIEEDNIYIFLCEVIENGYNYKKCLVAATEKWNLTYEQTSKIHYLMNNHSMASDSQFEKFVNDLEEIL